MSTTACAQPGCGLTNDIAPLGSPIDIDIYTERNWTCSIIGGGREGGVGGREWLGDFVPELKQERYQNWCSRETILTNFLWNVLVLGVRWLIRYGDVYPHPLRGMFVLSPPEIWGVIVTSLPYR